MGSLGFLPEEKAMLRTRTAILLPEANRLEGHGVEGTLAGETL